MTITELSSNAIAELVEGDLRQSFDQPTLWLDDVEVLLDPLEAGAMRSDSHVAMAWTVTGRNARDPHADGDVRRTFLGIGATGNPVVVHGITLVSDDPEGEVGQPVFTRVVDWAPVYAQLGMAPGRPVYAPTDLAPD